jgi:NADPH:quinone reductase-like Zn-dependent oxidoreductase
MKAIVQHEYGSSDVLHQEEIEKPAIGDDYLLVRVRAAGVDAGVWHVMAGQPYLFRLIMGLRSPKKPVPGIDLCGVVDAIGAKVTRVKPGDEVYGSCNPLADGSFAEWARVSEDRLAPKPSTISFEQAAAVPVSACTALQGLRDVGKVQAGQKVLVCGAGGGVGTYAVQLAKAFGAEVTAATSPSKAALAARLGADHVIDYTREDFTDGTRRYDVIVDIGGRRKLLRLRRALTPKGRLVIVGGEGGNRWTGGFGRQILRAPLLSLFVSQSMRAVTGKVNAADLDALRELIEAGKVTPVVDRTYPLAEAAEAVRRLHAGEVAGKFVLLVA